jgi:AraC-like DNA-binding protein
MQRYPVLLHFSAEMSDARDAFLKLSEQTLNFELLCAGDGPLPPGHTTGWRTLPCTVISHITGSFMRLDLDDRTLSVREGAYCITPGIHHCSSGVGGRCRWSHANFTVFGGVNVFTFLSLPPVLSRRTSQKTADLNGAIAALNDSMSSIKDSIARKSLGFRLLHAVLDDAALRSDYSVFVEGAQRLSPVLIHIRENLTRPLALRELARLVHLSPSRFNHVFRSALGISPRDYLQRERLQKAQELLIHSDMGIGEVGANVGWDNPFFFSRLFRKRCGQTPSAYRRSIRSGFVRSDA